MYDTILFDLDGTLTDPGVGITNSVAYSLEKFGIHNEDRRELYCFIGPPLTDSYREYYGFSEEDAVLAVKYYREYFSVKGIFENEVYDGVPEMLAALCRAGKKVILATSKPEEYARRIVEHFGLDGYFFFVGGGSMDNSRSSKDRVVRYSMANGQVTETSRAIMIGDRKHDIIGAKANGIDSVGVLYGYGSREELEAAGATYIAATPADVLKICLAD